MAQEGKVRLRSSDNEIFEVDEAVASESETMKNMIEDIGTGSVIPLLNINSKILDKIIEYFNYHVEAAKSAISAENVKKWDKEFAKVDLSTLYDLMQAANYLNIKKLLDFLFQTVADMINGKTPEEIRKTFDIKNDFTPEEEAEVLRETQWAFQ